MGLGPQQGTACVADSEHLGESTGSTGQVWSTNFGTQPLTISCGFPAPCLLETPRVLVSGFVVQDFFAQHGNLLIQMLNMLQQLRSQAAQLLSIELIEGSSRSHGADFD